MNFEMVFMSDQLLTGCRLVHLDNNRMLILIVYAKCSQMERRELWSHLGNRCVDVQPWLVVGDFNVIQEYREKIGGNSRSLSTMEEFNSHLNNCGPVEVVFQG